MRVRELPLEQLRQRRSVLTSAYFSRMRREGRQRMAGDVEAGATDFAFSAASNSVLRQHSLNSLRMVFRLRIQRFILQHAANIELCPR